MKYDILQDFPGSQDGTFTEQFKAGTQRELSAWLAPLAVSAGWASPVGEIDNKAIITDGSPRRGRPPTKPN